MGNEQLAKIISDTLNEKPIEDILHDLQKAIEVGLKYSASIDDMDIKNLLKWFKSLKDNRELFSSLSKVIDAEYERLSKTVIPNMLHELEMDSMKAHGKNFILSSRSHWAINNEKRTEAIDWLKQNGFSQIVREDANSRTLSASLNELLEQEGKTPPSDLIKQHTEEYTQVRKA